MSMRSGFSSKLGFVAAAAGSAVGLGNIWGFPFKVGAGGGAAFVLIYIAICFFLCYPVMVAEIAIGRRTQLNPVGAFKKLGFPKWAPLGLMGIMCGVLILSFYNVVAGWAFGYFLEMLAGNFEIGKQFGEYTKNIFKTGAYGLVFMVTTAFIVSKGISGGIEKASKVMMPGLFLILIMLTVYALTLDKASEGLSFYLVPDFSELNAKAVYSAMGQAFFSLSLGMGALITYGSYVRKEDNLITSAALVVTADLSVAFLSGLMMFPFVFSLGLEPTGGPGLIFVTLPGAFASFGPTLGILVGSLFFLLLCFAALTSTVSLLEVPVAYCVDELEWPRNRAVWILASFIFIIGIPSLMANGYSEFFTKFITYPGQENVTDFMTFVVDVANDSLLPLGGFLIAVFSAYVWRKDNLYKELSEGFPNFAQSFFGKYINFALRYVCPILLGAIFILTVLDRFLGIKLIA